MGNIFFTSDTHYGHANIVRGTTTWKVQEEGSNHGVQSLRDFDTLEEHNAAIVEGINSCVKAEDVLYHLGDWSFGGIDNIWDFRRRLICKNIHLIFGNHDEHIVKNKFLPHLFKDDNRCVHPSERKRELSKLKKSSDVFTQDLFSSTDYYKEISIDNGRGSKTKVVMAHYAMRVWNKSHHGALMLYGHSHDSLADSGCRSMDVGVDSAKRLLGEYRPFELAEVLSTIGGRAIGYVDHHNSATN